MINPSVLLLIRFTPCTANQTQIINRTIPRMIAAKINHSQRRRSEFIFSDLLDMPEKLSTNAVVAATITWYLRVKVFSRYVALGDLIAQRKPLG
jgi:hypothetical protein